MADNNDGEDGGLNNSDRPILRYVGNPFSDDIVSGYDDPNDTHELRLLSDAEKKGLVQKMKNFIHPSTSDAARLQGYSMNDAPKDAEGVPLKLGNSYTYPFGSNRTMKTKTLHYWTLVNEDLRKSWLNAILNPPTAAAQVVTGAPTKHEIARVLHILHDDQYNAYYNMLNTTLNRQGLDRRRTEAGNEDNGYVKFIDIFNDPLITYEHPAAGDGINCEEEKFTLLYPFIKDIFCNHEQANLFDENIQLRDAAWLKETWTYIKGVLTKVVVNFTRSGTYNTEDSQWIESAEHAQSLLGFNPDGLDWVYYAFTFVDKFAMGTYNKVIEGGVGMEDGETPSNTTTGSTGSRSRGNSGDLSAFVAVEQERLMFQRDNDGNRVRVQAATSLASIVPINDEERDIRARGIRFLSEMLERPPLPPNNLQTPVGNNNRGAPLNNRHK